VGSENPGWQQWPSVTAGWVRKTWSANASWLALGFLGIAGVLAIVVGVQSVELEPHHFYVKWGTVPEGFAAVAGSFAALGWCARPLVCWRLNDSAPR
jgi:hypothetical protein